MEFMERESPRDKEHPDYRLPLRKHIIEDESSKKFFDDLENMLDKKESRNYKEEARAALDKRTLAKTAEFNTTLERWLEENKYRHLMQQGHWKPEKQEDKLCPTKVGVTMAWQSASLIFAILCIINGVWPVILVSLPLMFAINLMWLINREGP